MRRFLIFPLLLLSIPAQAEPVHLDLQKCVDTAIRNSTLVLKSQNGSELSGEHLLQSYAQFLPRLDVNAGVNYSWGTNYYTFNGFDRVNGNTVQGTYGLSTSLNLFNGFADVSSFKASRDRLDASQFTLTRAKQQISIDVTQSYYQLILDQQIVEIDQKNLQADQARATLFNEEAQLGTLTLADAARQNAQVAQDQSITIAAQVKLHDDQLALLRKLRLDPKLTYQIAPADLTIPKAELSAGERSLLDSALSARTDLKATDATTSAANSDIQTARADYLPKVNLGFSGGDTAAYIYNQTANGQSVNLAGQASLLDQLGNQFVWTASLTLTWNLFDRGLTRLATSRARIAEDNSEIDLVDKKIEVQTEVRQAYGDYQSAGQSLDAAISGALAAKKAYDIILGRYKVGASSYVDLITAQATYLQTQITEAQARVTMKFQSKLLEFYLGKTPTAATTL